MRASYECVSLHTRAACQLSAPLPPCPNYSGDDGSVNLLSRRSSQTSTALGTVRGCVCTRVRLLCASLLGHGPSAPLMLVANALCVLKTRSSIPDPWFTTLTRDYNSVLQSANCWRFPSWDRCKCSGGWCGVAACDRPTWCWLLSPSAKRSAIPWPDSELRWIRGHSVSPRNTTCRSRARRSVRGAGGSSATHGGARACAA